MSVTSAYLQIDGGKRCASASDEALLGLQITHLDHSPALSTRIITSRPMGCDVLTSF